MRYVLVRKSDGKFYTNKDGCRANVWSEDVEDAWIYKNIAGPRTTMYGIIPPEYQSKTDKRDWSLHREFYALPKKEQSELKRAEFDRRYEIYRVEIALQEKVDV